VVELNIDWIKNVNYFLELSSTQDYAHTLAENGAEEGTLIISEVQSSGRGRRDRSWFSPKGGLWFSFILKPRSGLFRIPALTLGMGFGVVCGIEELLHINPLIKWPNDIFLSGKKLGGVLIDMEVKSGTLAYIIVGIGLNTNVSRIDFPLSLKENVISLRDVLGHPVDNIEMLGSILKEIGTVYRAFEENGFLPVLKEVKKRCLVLGKRVRVRGENPAEVIEGEAYDISENGGLILKAKSGEIRELFCGNVEIPGDI